MSEIGINITGHKSKGLEEFIKQDFDYVITGKISQALEGMIFKLYYFLITVLTGDVISRKYLKRVGQLCLNKSFRKSILQKVIY